jgi:hypothetical protein
VNRIGTRVFFPSPTNTSEREYWEEAVAGVLTGGDGERRRGCRAAAGVLLRHLQQVQRRGQLRNAGNVR